MIALAPTLRTQTSNLYHPKRHFLLCIFYFILFLFFIYIQFIVLRCISMLHVRSDVWIRSVPLRVQLLSYSCWDSGCSRFRPWFGVRLGGILSTTTRGRAIIAINVCFHPLTTRLYHRICV